MMRNSGSEELNITTKESQETKGNNDLNNNINSAVDLTPITRIQPTIESNLSSKINDSANRKNDNTSIFFARKKNGVMKRTKSEGDLSDRSPKLDQSPLLLDLDPPTSERATIQVEEELSEILFILKREEKSNKTIVLHHPRQRVLASCHELVKKSKKELGINNDKFVVPYKKKKTDVLDHLGIIKEGKAFKYLDGHTDLVNLTNSAIYIGICFYGQPLEGSMFVETIKEYIKRGVDKITILFGYHDYLNTTMKLARDHAVTQIENWLAKVGISNLIEHKNKIEILSRLPTPGLADLRQQGLSILFLETESEDFKLSKEIYQTKARYIDVVQEEVKNDANKFLARNKTITTSTAQIATKLKLLGGKEEKEEKEEKVDVINRVIKEASKASSLKEKDALSDLLLLLENKKNGIRPPGGRSPG